MEYQSILKSQQFVNVAWLSKILGMPQPSIYSKLQRGKFSELPPVTDMAGRYVWKSEDVQNWLQANKVQQ